MYYIMKGVRVQEVSFINTFKST